MAVTAQQSQAAWNIAADGLAHLDIREIVALAIARWLLTGSTTNVAAIQSIATSLSTVVTQLQSLATYSTEAAAVVTQLNIVAGP